MAGSEEYLTNRERELLASRDEFDKAVAIDGLLKLAQYLHDAKRVAEFARTMRPDQARKIGSKPAAIAEVLQFLMPPDDEDVPAALEVQEPAIEPAAMEDEPVLPPVVDTTEQSLPATDDRSDDDGEIEGVGDIEQLTTERARSGFGEKKSRMTFATWTQRFLDGDVTELSDDDRLALIEVIMQKRGKMRTNKLSLDYHAILEDWSNDISRKEIALAHNTTETSLGLSLYNLANKIRELNGGSKFNLEDLLAQDDGLHIVGANEQLESVSSAAMTTLEVATPEPQEIAPAPVTDHDRWHILDLSIEKPALVGLKEWEETVEPLLMHTATLQARMTAAQAELLWVQLHRDDHEAYKVDTPEAKEVRNTLASMFRSSEKVARIKDDRLKMTAMRVFVNVALGVKNLDDIHAELHKMNSKISPNDTQRYLTSAVLEILRDD